MGVATRIGKHDGGSQSLVFSLVSHHLQKVALTNTWWKDLNETMNTDKYCDYVNIHEFDPPAEHSWWQWKCRTSLSSQGDVM